MASLDGLSIGVIGLGLMGKPMARNLAAAGARLTVHNRSAGPMDELAGEGMTAAVTPAALAQSCDIVILMLTDTPAVEKVLFADNGLASALTARHLVIDMGTTAVAATRGFATRVEATGAQYVDAPVSGGERGAIDATLTVMAGGSDEAFARARPLLEVLGSRLTHVGGTGAGQIAKAVNQALVGMTIEAVAEALTLAKAAGADPARVRQALEGGFAWSRIMEVHGQRMLDGDFAPGARGSVQLKDMRQNLELAESAGLDLPALRLSKQLWQRMVDEGHGDLDHAGIWKIFNDD
jgi:3-hydroxyisobutyrate dehydrogenase-like beta-hydroxyacid dehydrogenase